MMPSKAELAIFWKSHDMAILVAKAALDYAEQVLPGGLYDPDPLPSPELECFRQRLQRAYEQAFSDNAKPLRPSLRVVAAQGD